MKVKLTALAKVVAKRNGLHITELTGHLRKNYATHPRFTFIWIARRKLGHSTTQIGRFLEGRDHTSICHATKRAEKLGLARPELVADIMEEAQILTEQEMSLMLRDNKEMERVNANQPKS